MAVAAKPRTTARERASSSMELWSWFFMRISGIILVFLVLGHFTIVHLIDDGIDRVNFAFVAGRWASPFWQTWDWAMLFLGLLHGANGLKNIVEEYVRRPGARAAIKSALYVLTFVFLLLGTLVILTFNPDVVST
ncbi:MAG TPA: succinate dehydrogenase hydrophobic membrane anchor subunit [Actinomycetota bacterium]